MKQIIVMDNYNGYPIRVHRIVLEAWRAALPSQVGDYTLPGITEACRTTLAVPPFIDNTRVRRYLDQVWNYIEPFPDVNIIIATEDSIAESYQ